MKPMFPIGHVKNDGLEDRVETSNPENVQDEGSSNDSMLDYDSIKSKLDKNLEILGRTNEAQTNFNNHRNGCRKLLEIYNIEQNLLKGFFTGKKQRSPVLSLDERAKRLIDNKLLDNLSEARHFIRSSAGKSVLFDYLQSQRSMMSISIDRYTKNRGEDLYSVKYNWRFPTSILDS